MEQEVWLNKNVMPSEANRWIPMPPTEIPLKGIAPPRIVVFL